MDLITYGYNNDVITDADILKILDNECAKLGLSGLDEIENISSAKFNILLVAVGRFLNSIKALWNDPVSINRGLNKEYIYVLVDYYIYICNVYNKRCCMSGAKYFLGLHTQCLTSTVQPIYKEHIENVDVNNIYINNNVNNNSNSDSSIYNNVYSKAVTVSELRTMCQQFTTIFPYVAKMITDADNDIQLSNARDSKQAVLNLGYNNYMHGWNGAIKANETKQIIKSLDEIKQEHTISSTKNENRLNYNDFI